MSVSLHGARMMAVVVADAAPEVSSGQAESCEFVWWLRMVMTTAEGCPWVLSAQPEG